MKNHVASLIVGLIMIIIGLYLFKYTSFEPVEIPAIVVGLGLLLVTYSALQRLFKDTLPKNLLLFGLFFVFLPAVLTVKAGFEVWMMIILLIVGIICIAAAFRKKNKTEVED